MKNITNQLLKIVVILSLFISGCKKTVDTAVLPNTTPLVATFSVSNENPKLNETITFKDESKGNPTSWTWDFGDGTTSIEQNPKKSYTKLGAYIVKLTVSKAGVASQSATNSITVIASVLTLSSNTQSVVATANTTSITLTTNNSWTASSNSIWLKVSPISGNAGTNMSVNFTIDANTTTTSRTGIVTFASGGLTQTYTLTQAGTSTTNQNGTVFIGSDDGKLYAIDALTGTKKWDFLAEETVYSKLLAISSPTVFEQSVYFGSLNKKRYALDIQTGKKQWELEDLYSNRSSGIVKEGLYFVGNGSQVLAIDIKTGLKRYTYYSDYVVIASPTISNGYVFFSNLNGNLYAYEIATMKKKWSYLSDFRIESGSTVQNGVLYTGFDNGYVYAFDAFTGEKKVEFLLQKYEEIKSFPVVFKDVLYISGTRGVYAFDVKTGLKLWMFNLNLGIQSTLFLYEDIIYIGDATKLFAIDIKTGKQKWEFSENNSAFTSSPVVVNKTVYVGSLNNRLYAIDAQTGIKKWEYLTGGNINSSPCIVTSDGKVYHSNESGY